MVSDRVTGCARGAILISMACGSPLMACGSPAGGGPGADVEAPPAGSGNMMVGGSGNPMGMGSSSGGSEGQVGAGASIDNGTSITTVPCDVAQIVSEHCTTCHGSTPKFNAPMSLVSAADFGAMAPISNTEPVRSVASRRINAEGARRMPPPGTVEALDAEQRAALTAWLDGGARAAAEGCSIGDGATTLPGADELLPRPTLPGTVLGPYVGWDEDGVECYPFITHNGDKTTPYEVGDVVDQYIGFGFNPPWEGTRYVRAFKAVIDNAQALHHFILFEEPSADDGSIEEVIGAHPGGQMLHGWAPGGTDLYFTPDVGVRMDSGTGYLLEVHYNSSDSSAVDASGLEICVTAAPPENEAIISWLGTDAINGTRASGTCTPRADEPIHIIAGTPHMHLKGSAMKVTVERAAGGTEVVHDEAFSFQNQRGYQEDLRILPGDSITTECTYSAPASFGKGTNEEMCYWFALAYPAGALADGGFLGALAHGANACLGR